MDLPFLNAYLEAIGAPSFRKGCNFAAAGSTVLPATASSVSPFSFGIQVAQFFRFKARVLDLHARSKHFDFIIYNQARMIQKTRSWLKIFDLLLVSI